jgi:hypothetical protein
MKSRKILSLSALVLLAAAMLSFIIIRADHGAKVHWTTNNPFYRINADGLQNASSQACLADPVSTINSAFNTWNSVPNSAIDVSYGGVTSISDFCGMDASNRGCDANSLVVFTDSSIFPSHALAVTVNYYSTADGRMLGTDVVFNDAINWSDDPQNHFNPNCKGDDFYSLAGVATHEIGHFYGLDHSPLAYLGGEFAPSVSAIMFPFYFGNSFWHDMTVLKQDDIAGLVSLYPAGSLPAWGKISGKVTNNGDGMFGVHVAALKKSNKIPTVGTLTAPDGTFEIFGLPSDQYYVFVESPLIAGQSFLADISEYYANADKTPYVQLYQGIGISALPQLAPGSTVFGRATTIGVTPNQTSTDINFSYGSPSSGSSSSGGGGGCDLNPHAPSAQNRFDLSLVLILLILAAMWRARKSRID